VTLLSEGTAVDNYERKMLWAMAFYIAVDALPKVFSFFGRFS
jgi:hypothetical protein